MGNVGAVSHQGKTNKSARLLRDDPTTQQPIIATAFKPVGFAGLRFISTFCSGGSNRL
jgi:hypothetical protein